MAYECEQCGASFQKLSQLKHHQRTENHWPKYGCPSCKKTFTRKDNLERHMRKHRDENNHHCPECLRVFTRRDALDEHFMQHQNQVGGARKRSAQIDEGPVVKRLRNDDDPQRFYNVTKIREQRIEKFKTTASTYKVSFKDIKVTDNVLVTLKKLFAAIFEDITKGAKSSDLVRLVVQSPSLDYPIFIPFDKLPTLTPDRFMAEIERVLQSNEDFAIDEALIFEVTLVDMPNGGSRKRCKFVNTDKFILNKKCILQIQNQDDLCCARAIVTAKARLEQHKKWESIRKGGKIQEEMAKQLHLKAGVAVGKCGIEEIKQFQNALPDYQLYVISQEHFNAVIFKGPDAEEKIFLYYHDQHYDLITSMSAFLSRNYFCTNCEKGYDHKERHKCNNTCHACRHIHDPCNVDWIQCIICNRFFSRRRMF